METPKDNPETQSVMAQQNSQESVSTQNTEIQKLPQSTNNLDSNCPTTSLSLALDQSDMKLENDDQISVSSKENKEPDSTTPRFQSTFNGRETMEDSNPDVEIDYQKLSLIREALQQPEAISSVNVIEVLQKLAKSKNINQLFGQLSEEAADQQNSWLKSNTISKNTDPAVPSTSVPPQPPAKINVQRDKFAKEAGANLMKKDNSSSGDSDLELHTNAKAQGGYSRSSNLNIDLSSAEEDDEDRRADNDGVNCGEFHAFNKVTTAVVDMAIVILDKNNISSSYRLIAAGQNGSINEINLNTKMVIRSFTKHPSSVTRICIDYKQKYLLANFYDNTLTVFNLNDAAMLHTRLLTSRVDSCCAGLPLADEPDAISKFYLGLFNGDILLLNLNGMFITVLTRTRNINTNMPSSITSIAICPNKSGPVLIVGSADNSITIRNLNSGSLISRMHTLNHDHPPFSITPFGDQNNCIFSYSQNSFKIHDWKASKGIGTIHAPGITCAAKLDKHVAIGDNDGAIKIHRIIEHTMSPKPVKVFFLTSKSAVTCLTSYGQTLLAGSMDGSVTVMTISESVSKYKCLYGDQPCCIKFKSRLDLVNHIMADHIKFSDQVKIIHCLWRAYRCKVKFNCEQSRRSIRGHLLSHVPD